jgi:aldose 1-epimerase
MRAAVALLLPFMTEAANYTARQTVADGVPIVELSDAAHQTQVSIAPSVGNMAYQIEVAGKNILWFPYHSPAELRDNPQLCGVPFLAPWANRLDDDAFWANGKRYLLNPDLGNLRRDNHRKPIHGLLGFSPAWVLVEASADGHAAWATSRLEFWKHPEMMAQFPFAHTITMTYRLSDGAVEVETTLDNHSTDPMPVAIGYHPYFHLSDAPRDRWKIHLAARERVLLSNLLIPTGERKPMDLADPYPLAGAQLDDVFANLTPGEDGRAHFWVEGQRERITVTYGIRYPVAVVYAPPAREFICFEPMAAITDAFNLAHAGVIKDLQSIPPGGQWKESFWITPSGFR